jgi:hypothetical protein
MVVVGWANEISGTDFSGTERQLTRRRRSGGFFYQSLSFDVQCFPSMVKSGSRPHLAPSLVRAGIFVVTKNHKTIPSSVRNGIILPWRILGILVGF